MVKEDMPEKVRLNKYLSEAGVCSRRQADRLLEEGRILVDGQPALMGQKVSPGQEILVDGRNIREIRRKEIASYMSFLSQMTRVYYSYSVFETVMQGRYVHGGSFFSGAA